MWVLFSMTCLTATVCYKYKGQIAQLATNWLSKKIIETHHNRYIINYPHGAKWYKIIVPRNRQPFILNSIVDEHDNDVKSTIVPFMGPNHNFHGVPTTPQMLGFEKLTFSVGLDPIVTTFEKSQYILF